MLTTTLRAADAHGGFFGSAKAGTVLQAQLADGGLTLYSHAQLD